MIFVSELEAYSTIISAFRAQGELSRYVVGLACSKWFIMIMIMIIIINISRLHVFTIL